MNVFNKSLDVLLEDAHGIFAKARDKYQGVIKACEDEMNKLEKEAEALKAELEAKIEEKEAKIHNAGSVLVQAANALKQVKKITGDE